MLFLKKSPINGAHSLLKCLASTTDFSRKTQFRLELLHTCWGKLNSRLNIFYPLASDMLICNCAHKLPMTGYFQLSAFCVTDLCLFRCRRWLPFIHLHVNPWSVCAFGCLRECILYVIRSVCLSVSYQFQCLRSALCWKTPYAIGVNMRSGVVAKSWHLLIGGSWQARQGDLCVCAEGGGVF